MSEEARTLLEEALRLLCLTAETPLGGGIDAAGMANVARRRARARLGAGFEEPTVADLDVLMETRSGAPDLATWFQRTHERLRPTHPRAFAIAILRLEGCTDREIAARLDLGPRLVKRIRTEGGAS